MGKAGLILKQLNKRRKQIISTYQIKSLIASKNIPTKYKVCIGLVKVLKIS